MAALAARGHCVGTHTWAELDDRDEAVAIVAIPALRSRLRLRTNGCERAVTPLGKRHRDARRGVAVARMDRGGDSLEAVELSPGQLPAAEVARQRHDRLVEQAQLQLRAGVARKPHHHPVAGFRL